jgi:outer membrane protein assembly factor BamA
MNICRLRPWLLGALFACASAPACAAAGPADEAPAPVATSGDQVVSLPFAFYSEFFGAAVGFVTFRNGYPQPQARVLGTILVGSKGSVMAFFMGRDIRVPGTERLYLDPWVSVGYFAHNRAYVDGNPAYRDERSGSNDSSPNNYITGNGEDLFTQLRFKYLLPIGHGRDQAVSSYRFEDGLLVSGATGGDAWNPLKSGKTFLELQPFYRSLQVDSTEAGIHSTRRTSGLDGSIFWDNRDWPDNPARGGSTRARVSRDWGEAGSSGSWTVVEGEADYYQPLGRPAGIRQQVLALDLWTAYSPTWETSPDGTVRHGPPGYTGATLGGLWRLRGYSAERFSDKAAACAAVEYRLIPDWNPFERLPWIQRRCGIQWLQMVAFAEAGRVAPTWQFEQWRSALKWDAGLGVRIQAKGLVARLDFAHSREETGVQMMVGHPFQF